MKQLKMGIIGVGNMGSFHAQNIAEGKISGMQLCALCDIDPQRTMLLKQQYPTLPVFTDADTMLKQADVDAIIIATPHYFHPQLAVLGFQNGKHVLTEKPAGVRVSDVRRMNAAAKASGKAFGIMFNQRTNPLFYRAKEMVESGALGQLKRLVWIITNWYRTQSYYDSGGWRATWAGEGGGVLLNQAPHNLDLTQWIFGMPDRVRGFCSVGKYHHIEVEDDATIYMEYASGATAAFITSTGESPGTNRLEITGDKGKIVLEDGKLKWWKLGAPEREFCFQEKSGFFKPQMDYTEYRPEEPETAHCGILQNFANHILNGEPLIAPGEDGILSLSISNAAYLSAWEDRWVKPGSDDDEFDRALQQRIDRSVVVKTKGQKSGENKSERWQVRW